MVFHALADSDARLSNCCLRPATLCWRLKNEWPLVTSAFSITRLRVCFPSPRQPRWRGGGNNVIEALEWIQGNTFDSKQHENLFPSNIKPLFFFWWREQEWLSKCVYFIVSDQALLKKTTKKKFFFFFKKLGLKDSTMFCRMPPTVRLTEDWTDFCSPQWPRQLRTDVEGMEGLKAQGRRWSGAHLYCVHKNKTPQKL